MAEEFVLGIDEGTTGVRALVLSEDLHVVGEGYTTFQQHYPRPGWVEHDAGDIWDATLASVGEALDDAELEPGELSTIGITNQRETTLLWDRDTGEPIHRAIVWQDRRTAPRCDALRDAGHEDHVRETTGLLLDAYFSGTKIAWLLDHVEGARERAEAGELAFGTMDTWLLWKLTAGEVHATDPSNASRTLLYDIGELAWSDAMLELLDVPAALLPEVRDSSGRFGTTHADVLGAEVPVSGIAGDQQAALFGQGCFTPGMVKNTYGTGSFVLANTGRDRVETQDLLTTVAWSLDGEATYALEGSVFVAGAAVQWLQEELGLVEDLDDVEPLARSVEDAGGVVFVPALTGLGAPHWDPDARGTLLGLTRGTQRGHLVRAALEAVAYQSHDVVQAMEAESGHAVERVRVDGGMTGNRFLLQFQADVLDAPVERPALTETTVLGAGMLAGLAEGVWADLDEVAAVWRVDERFDPAMDPDERRELLTRWHRGVERAKGWADGS